MSTTHAKNHDGLASAVTPPLTITGIAANQALSDVSSINPFANLTLNDKQPWDLVSAQISFTAGNGQLSGPNLSAATLINGQTVVNLAAVTPTQLQQELNALVFSPAPHQVKPGATVDTPFKLTFHGGGISLLDKPERTFGGGDNGFTSPLALTLDKNGDLFVAYGGNQTIEEYSASGSLLRILSAGVSNLMALTTDVQGDLFVTDSTNNTVLEYTPGGVLLHTLSTGVSYPDALALDSKGELFVANAGANTVEEFSRQGVLIRALGAGIAYPAALAIDQAGHLFVADEAGGYIQEFSNSGVLLQTLGQGLDQPAKLAIDRNGDLFVSNLGGVAEFSSAGVLLRTLSDGSNHFSPGDISVDSAGNLYVSSAYPLPDAPPKVWEFSASGVLAHVWSASLANPAALTVDGKGDLFVANSISETNSIENVQEYATQAIQNYVVSQTGPDVTVTAAAIAPPKVALGAAQTLYAGSVANISGLSIHDAAAGSAPISVQLSDGSGILNAAAPGVDGRGEHSRQLTLTGSLAAVNAALATLTDAHAKLGADNIRISVTDAGTQLSAVATDHIDVISAFSATGFTTQGKFTDTAVIHPFANLSLADGLLNDRPYAQISFPANRGGLSSDAISANASVGGIAVYTLSPASPAALQQELRDLTFTPNPGPAQTTRITLSLFGGEAPTLTLSSGLNHPDGVAIDAQGDIYVASLDNTLKEYSAAGVLLKTFSSQLSLPAAPYNYGANQQLIAVDSRGALYALGSNGDILEFSNAGTPLQTLHTGLSALTGLAVDPRGDVFAMNHNNVIEFSASGNLIQNDMHASASVAFDAQGDIFIAANTGVISEYSASGGLLQAFSDKLSYSPSALAVDNQGDIFIANGPGATIDEYSTGGALIKTYHTGLSDAAKLVLDAKGDLYVADIGNNTVTEYAPNGVLMRVLSTGIVRPQDLALDAQGDLIVANVGVLNGESGSVEIFPPLPSATYQNSATVLTLSPAPIVNGGGLDAAQTAAAPVQLTGVLDETQAMFNGRVLSN